MCVQFILKCSIGLLVVFIALVCCDSIEIIPNAEEVNQSLGNRFLITCKGDKQLSWINPKGVKLSLKKGRVHIEQRENNLLSLVFDKIEAQDQGIWACVSSKLGPSFKKHFKLNIYESMKFANLNPVQTLTEKKNEVISCTVTGTPKPVVTWVFNGNKINPTGKKYIQLKDGLLIKDVNNADRGEYHCKAYQISSTISNIDERVIRVKVRGSPIFVNASSPIFYGYLGGKANVSCKFESITPTQTRWFRKGNFSFNNQVNSISSDSTNFSILEVLINDATAFGEYFCNSTNNFGTTTGKIYLNEGNKPKIPQKILLRHAGPLSLDLYVKNIKIIENEMNIQGYRFEILSHHDFNLDWKGSKVYEFEIQSGNLYKLLGLEENTHYFIRIASRNVAGLSDWSKTLEYATDTQAETEMFAFRTSMAHKLKFNLVCLVLLGFFLTIRNTD